MSPNSYSKVTLVTLREKIQTSPFLKSLVLSLLKPKNQYRPRWWVKVFWNPFRHNRGKGSVICRRTRLDVMPYNKFDIGKDSIIEDFATINNAVGDIFIGDRTLIGISDVIIGPVKIGNDVMLAQNVVMSGMNHIYEDISKPINQQMYTTKQITVEDGAWIGANAVIVAGVTIGQNAVVAAGSVVTHDVAPFTVVAGNPARLLREYDMEKQEWIKK